MASALASVQNMLHGVLLSGSPEPKSFPLSEDNINQCVRQAEYAVRGEIVSRAGELEKELQSGKKLPFDKIIYCNIGNPQQLKQKPITFFRQVLALCDYPEMLEWENVGQLFPADVISRAKEYMADMPGGTGAYSASTGAEICRQQVAKGIERRDGYPSDPNNIFLTNGASGSVHAVMRVLLRGPQDGVLAPVPAYPLYQATLKLYNGTLVPYYLNEEEDWQLDLGNLKDAVAKAKEHGTNVRGIVVINPGNPTGSVLSRGNIEDIVRFCQAEKLVLLADEVYQDNIYAQGKEFVSFKKVLRDLGDEYSDVVLISMHSISKGFYGECGRRGGYAEVVGCPPDVVAQLKKLASIDLCSNINGQICTALMMQPPQEGDPSYKLYAKEREGLLGSLKRRAQHVHEVLNRLEGVTCNEPEGSLYAMPRIRLSSAAIQAAEAAGKAPDFLYCKELLEATGIVTVPGSGFSQVEGTYHFRTTILPPEDEIEAMCDRLSKFHADFVKKYGAA